MPARREGATFVTGASSGIGRAICERLAGRGHPVFAGARKEGDLDELSKINSVTPVRLDITSSADVVRAADIVRSSGISLVGLVNNAGVAGISPLMDTPEQEFTRVLDVNLVGAHRMVHAFRDLLIKSHGRIVNITSIGGMMTETWLGPYGTSKHALEGYSEILHDELATKGFHVSTIAPGPFRTKIGTNFYDFAGGHPEKSWADSIFREQAQAVFDWFVSTPGALDRSMYPDPIPVADAVLDALFSETPKSRYLVTTREDAETVLDRMLQRIIEVNQGQDVPLTGPELVSRLQKLLGKSD